jgi:hypothetical protein
MRWGGGHIVKGFENGKKRKSWKKETCRPRIILK